MEEEDSELNERDSYSVEPRAGRTASKALVSSEHGRIFPTVRVWTHREAVGHRER